MRNASFRSKIVLAMSGIVTIVTVSIIIQATHKFTSAYRQNFDNRFQEATRAFHKLRNERLVRMMAANNNIGRSIRIQTLFRAVNAAMDPNAQSSSAALTKLTERLYTTAEDELRYELEPTSRFDPENAAVMFRFLSETCDIIPPPKDSDAGKIRGEKATEIESILSEAARLQAEAGEGIQTGYLAWQTRRAGTDKDQLVEIILTPIIDNTTYDYLGAYVIGYPSHLKPATQMGDSEAKNERESSALLLDKQIFLAGKNRAFLEPHFLNPLINAKAHPQKHPVSPNSIRSKEYEYYLTPVATAAGLPFVQFITAFSTAEMTRQLRALQRQIALIGLGAFFLGLIIGWILSKGLVAPVKALSQGAQAVAEGNYDIVVEPRSEDEIGRLTVEFNKMTKGLALKEKYRGVLNKVADKAIADRLLNDLEQGDIQLGGESKEVSVLFCDIRGFTAMTQSMPPQDVIELLNNHFRPLTKIVTDHGGAVDKFVGDLIMAIFGAPEHGENDKLAAMRCAAAMINKRNELNRMEAPAVYMGIGIASGLVVAGNMGSEDRIDYTVLGDRVNLAARLCSKAESMAVVVDEPTYESCREEFQLTPLPPLSLKGFDLPIQAYSFHHA